MRKKVTIFFILITILFTTLIIGGCSNREEDKIKSISIRDNSFKTIYEIDEELNYDNIFILVTKEDGTSEYVNCVEGMVVGFDTTTTTSAGEYRSLHIEYKGVVSEEVNYEVKYFVDNTKEILTSARINASKSLKNNTLSICARFYSRDLTNVNTILFTLRSNEDMNILEDCSNLSFEKPNGWDIQYDNTQDNQTLKLVFYNKVNSEGLSDNHDFIINIAEGDINLDYSIIDIEVAKIDENKNVSKYYLPDIYDF